MGVRNMSGYVTVYTDLSPPSTSTTTTHSSLSSPTSTASSRGLATSLRRSQEERLQAKRQFFNERRCKKNILCAQCSTTKRGFSSVCAGYAKILPRLHFVIHIQHESCPTSSDTKFTNNDSLRQPL